MPRLAARGLEAEVNSEDDHETNADVYQRENTNRMMKYFTSFIT
jgi:hypothetical protein